ncbi:hypothetical protein CNECB9_2370007 [Cupriavidus necator]|uniref:Uncharacterized protein n=1 Tax=Cupriavidus necator TaxID=106590 RepID=A0A1K0IDN3_CUPNE|nr:hypothetical protein CNECB9_2370007 [Cupriavidus necator]
MIKSWADYSQPPGISVTWRALSEGFAAPATARMATPHNITANHRIPLRRESWPVTRNGPISNTRRPPLTPSAARSGPA